MNQPSARIPDDAIHDPYAALQAPSSPAVCGQCGAVFADSHWQWSLAPSGAAATTCPACLRLGDRQPAGELTVDPHLARGLGEALQERFRARASYTFAKGEHLLRVAVGP